LYICCSCSIFIFSVFSLLDINAANPPGLYFKLSGRVITGNEVNITDIRGQPTNRSDPGSTLVCVTGNVNNMCCRNLDTGSGRIGGWYHNDKLVITTNNASNRKINDVFVSAHYTHQVRLAVIGHPTTPIGEYTCRVPNENGTMIDASISLINIMAGK